MICWISFFIGVVTTIVVLAVLLTAGLVWASSDRNEYFEPYHHCGHNTQPGLYIEPGE